MFNKSLLLKISILAKISLVANLLLFISALSAFSTIPISPRSGIPQTDTPLYSICSPYSEAGKPCTWVGGIEIPVFTSGSPKYGTMVTLVLPYANPGWQLYRSNFAFTLDMVYSGDCKNTVFSYTNDVSLYLNDSVCK